MSICYISSDEEFKSSGILEVLQQNGKFFMDTETVGLNPKRLKFCLLQIKCGEQVYIVSVQNISKEHFDRLMEVLNRKDTVWIFHNACFDLQVFYSVGVNVVAQIEDTMLMESCLYQGETKDRLKLKALAKNYCGIEMDKTMQTSDWNRKLTTEQIQYAVNDVIVLEKVYEALSKEVSDRNLSEVVNIENRAVKATARMEYTGVFLDVAKARELKREYKEQLRDDERIFRLNKVNVNSPSQVKSYLNKQGICVRKTSKEELAKYTDNETVNRILKIKNLRSQIRGIESLLEGRSRVDGRVYCRYNQNMTSTGRYSTSSPNIQGLPHGNAIRELVVASAGKKLIICDFSQVELRIIAEVANDEAMMKAYIEEKDLHRMTASIVNGIPYDEVTPEQRKAAKAMNFGLIYGMSGRTFVSYAKKNYGVDIDIVDASDMIGNFFGLYQQILERIYRMEDKEDNFESTRSGRTRIWREGLPSMNQRANYEVQGLGADIIKIALAEVESQLVVTGKADLLIMVHDEIVLETDKDNAEVVATELKRIMEDAARVYIKKVPIIADVSIGDNWAAK